MSRSRGGEILGDDICVELSMTGRVSDIGPTVTVTNRPGLSAVNLMT